MKSAKKADEKWEKAKEKGKHIEPYVPTESERKPRVVVPVVVTLANYYLAKQNSTRK